MGTEPTFSYDQKGGMVLPKPNNIALGGGLNSGGEFYTYATKTRIHVISTLSSRSPVARTDATHLVRFGRPYRVRGEPLEIDEP